MEPVEVTFDDSGFRRLVEDAAGEQARQRAEWSRISLERDLKQSRHFSGSVAGALVGLAADEKQALLSWFSANPLPNRDMELVARLMLGDGAALEEVVAGLRGTDAQRTGNLVWYLGWFDWKTVPRLFEQRDALLIPLLDHADASVVGRLTMSLDAQGEQFWWPHVRERLLEAAYPHKGVLVRLLRKSSSPEALAVIETALARRMAGDKPDSFVYLLTGLAIRDDVDDEIKTRADEVLFVAVERDGPEDYGAALTHLLRRDPRRALPLSEKYLAHVMANPASSAAHASLTLFEWARWRGKEQEHRLRAWTGHPGLGFSALQALTEINAGSGDETLIELWQARAASGDSRVPYAIAAVGGDAAKRAALRLLRQGGASRLADPALLWLLKDISLQRALETSVRCGLLPRRPSADTLRQAVQEGDALTPAYSVWQRVLILEARAAFFDTETSTFPNRHDQLIVGALKKGGAGIFRPTRAVEVWREKGEYYDVAFEHAGKWFRFRARGQGDWYDVTSVLVAANRALEVAGRAEGFHEVKTGDQCCFVVFGELAQLEALAAELWLPIGSQVDNRARVAEAIEAEAARLGII
jgi:hypothetical protein